MYENKMDDNPGSRDSSEALLENELRVFIDAVRDYAIFMLDSQGRVASWNAGAERLKGYEAHEIIGKHFSVFYSEEARLRAHPENELRIAMAEGRYEEEGWRVRKDGSQFWANVVITAVFDRNGRHIGFTKVTRDVTERRQAEDLLRQSEERIRLLIEGVKDYAIYMLDPHGKIATWNHGAQLVTGFRAPEVLDKHFSIFFPREAVENGRPEHVLRIAESEGRYEEEGFRIQKNGEYLWVEVVITAIRDPANNALRGFATIVRDLTERRRVEREARAAAEDARNQRARAIEAGNAVRLRDEFISVAAHELRTPLTALRLKMEGLAQALRKTESAASAAQIAKHTERLNGALRQVSRLGDLVERLLDVSRIVQGRLDLNPEEVDLTALTSQVVEDFRESSRETGSELRLEAFGTIVGNWDRARLEQVLVNLISNAIKYGAGQPIRVQVEAVDDKVKLSVTDSGIGIAPEHIDRIFARFERAAPISHYGGLGLGLYVSRNIVEAHGGSIKVISAPGAGSTFVVDLPRCVVLADEANTELAEPA